MFLFGMMVVIFIFFVILIYALIKMRNVDFNDRKESHDMFKSFYLYLVLFATLMMSIGGSVGVFMSTADFVSPVTYQQTFEDYKMGFNEQEIQKNTDELKIAYDEMISSEKEQAKERALNGIIKSLGWILIPFPIFLFFQRQLRKEKEE